MPETQTAVKLMSNLLSSHDFLNIVLLIYNQKLELITTAWYHDSEIMLKASDYLIFTSPSRMLKEMKIAFNQ